MKIFNIRKSVKAKLSLGFGLILILVCVLGFFSLTTLHKNSTNTKALYTKNLRGLQDTAVASGLLAGMQSDILTALATNDAGDVDKLAGHITATRKQINARLQRYYASEVDSVKGKREAKQVIAAEKAFAPKLQTFIDMAKKGDLGAAKDYYTIAVSGPFADLRAHLSQLSDYNARQAALFYQQIEQDTHTARAVIMALIGVVLLLVLVTTVMLARMIVRPLNRAHALVNAIGEGRLDNAIANPYRDEFGTMICALAAMQTRLAEIVHGVREGSDSVSTGAGQIASGNDELSTRTQEQAANLEQTAASMEQMTSTVKQNADNAAQADQLAQGVRRQASEGGEVVGRAVRSMEEINEASRKITHIVSLIDDIAFQTNLLALNASVEAARAGEQGRGFAVVASEVRNLAGRSAEAAKDIKSLVENSASKVAEGSREVELSGKTLEEIVESINKVSDIVAEIAAASKEQSSGIEQVNMAVSQMDSMTQQNAALVEESAAASRALETQADALKQQAAFFRLQGDDSPAAVVPDPMPENEIVPTAAPAEIDASPEIEAPAPEPPRSRPRPQLRPVTSSAEASDEEEWATF